MKDVFGNYVIQKIIEKSNIILINLLKVMMKLDVDCLKS